MVLRRLLRFRKALLALSIWLPFLGAPVLAQGIIDARFSAPTDRYAHGVLGDAIEWGALELDLEDGSQVRFELPQSHVFEDVAPRLLDVDQDGALEVVVVETDMTLGAAMAIYSARGKLAETPHIGTRNRWLAPLGAADLDGDGVVELAYVDRPHLAKTLRIWRFEAGALKPMANLPGFTNHRIGEADIAGGIRDCGQGPEMILATADWRHLIALKWDGELFSKTPLRADTSRPSFADAMKCR